MTPPLPSFEDLRLVLAVGRRGSIGSAAEDLRISQPSASQRLARLEKLVGVRLFNRDSRGARPTTAGLELIAQAEHILGHLDVVYDMTRAADATSPRLVIGAAHGLASTVFPALDAQLEDIVIDQHVDQDARLIELAAEGSLDAAFVGVLDETALPRNAVIGSVGQDDLVLLLPAGLTVDGSISFEGAEVVVATYGEDLDALASEILARGATVRLGITPATALAMARRGNRLAVFPRSTVLGQLLPGERLIDASFRHRPTLSVVSSHELAPPIAAALGELRKTLGLRPIRRQTRPAPAAR
ncbi:LysR family transcriptional regulator [Kribbella sp. NPDC050820]|uniref:LysR family transcriptional regulator n=1 Tax=Kribbella sp. NPDC050820 TaxID=3155408 RepID=UPI0033DB10FD